MNRQIRILNIITRLGISGGSFHALLVTKLFTNEEYQSYVLSGKIEAYETDMTYLADEYGIKPYYIESMSRSIHPIKDIFTIIKMMKIIRQIKPDIVHTHTAKAGFVGRVSAWLCGVPIIVHTFHGNNFRGYFGKMMTLVSISIERWMARISDRIIVISNQQQNELLHFNIVTEKKIRIIPLGFDFSNIIHQSEDKGKFRKQFKIADNQHIIAFIGRLTAIKNPRMFLDIAKELIKSRDDLTFCLIGDGEMKAELEMEIKVAHLTDRIIFTGFIQEMKPIYADIDILLLTSLNEGTPVTIIEAMANRKIVISSLVGGVGDLIEHGKNGFTYQLDNEQLFVKAIHFVVDHPNDFVQVRDNAFKKITNIYSIDNLERNLSSLFHELIEAKLLLE